MDPIDLPNRSGNFLVSFFGAVVLPHRYRSCVNAISDCAICPLDQYNHIVIPNQLLNAAASRSTGG